MFPLPRKGAHGQQVPKIPEEMSQAMGPATVPLTNEKLKPRPLPLEPLKVEETKEPLESLEMAAERIQILDPVKSIHRIKKPEAEIIL